MPEQKVATANGRMSGLMAHAGFITVLSPADAGDLDSADRIGC
jgi:hypothetical protein